MYKLPKGDLTKKQYEAAIEHAIAIELTTIPCYLSTYYSVKRAQDQETVYNTMFAQVNDKKLAEELTMDVLLYANKAAGIIMSVAVEEMLHMSLACNVNQASVAAPKVMDVGESLSYPATLFADATEFKINRAPLSLSALITFLEIESPNEFEKDPTIGVFYEKLITYVKNNDMKWRDTGKYPQLVPTQPYYSANSINTVYYDANHKPQYPNAADSGGIIEVDGVGTAVAAMNEIIHQGEGPGKGTQLVFEKDGKTPKPLKVVDGKVVGWKHDDYDDLAELELSHFAKFMELYSLGVHFDKKFKKNKKLGDFFSYFVYDQAINPYTTDYDKGGILYCKSELANALYTYILLMIETCYYQKLPSQYEVFMMGIHKSMIWLLSQFGNDMNNTTYVKGKETYEGAVTFEFFKFKNSKTNSPKAQIVVLAQNLIDECFRVDPSKGTYDYDWLFTSPEYLLALPDVLLNHTVNKVPLTTPNI
jgi:hypothetical protein